MLFAALKDKNALTAVMKENLRLKQLRLNYINNQKNKKKEHLILVISPFRVGVVSSVLEQLTVAFLVFFKKP